MLCCDSEVTDEDALESTCGDGGVGGDLQRGGRGSDGPARYKSGVFGAEAGPGGGEDGRSRALRPSAQLLLLQAHPPAHRGHAGLRPAVRHLHRHRGAQPAGRHLHLSLQAAPHPHQPAAPVSGRLRPAGGPGADAGGDPLHRGLLVPGRRGLHALLHRRLRHHLGVGGQHGADLAGPLRGHLRPAALPRQGDQEDGADGGVPGLAGLPVLPGGAPEQPPAEPGHVQLLPGGVRGGHQLRGGGDRPGVQLRHPHHRHHRPLPEGLRGGGVSGPGAALARHRRHGGAALGGRGLHHEEGAEGGGDSGARHHGLPPLLLPVLRAHAGGAGDVGGRLGGGLRDLAGALQLLPEPHHLRLLLPLVQEVHQAHRDPAGAETRIPRRENPLSSDRLFSQSKL